MYESRDANPYYQSADADFDAARAEWERHVKARYPTAADRAAMDTAAREDELDRLRADAEADRLGTAGMREYITQLEGLLRDLAQAWGNGHEPDEDIALEPFLAVVEGVVHEWERIDPENQG